MEEGQGDSWGVRGGSKNILKRCYLVIVSSSIAIIPYHKQTSVPCLSRKHLHHKNLKALFVLRDSVFSPYYPGLPLPQDGTTSISICPASLFSHLLLPPALRSAEELHGIQPRRCPAPRLCPKEAREAALLTPHHAWSQPPRLLDAEGQPCFVARDVALALGYEKPGTAIQQHCKK